jgi:hypothetical protein
MFALRSFGGGAVFKTGGWAHESAEASFPAIKNKKNRLLLRQSAMYKG